MPDPEPAPTPEPVLTADWWKATVTALILTTVSVLGALDVWRPTEDQVTAFTGAAAVVIATVFPLIAFYVRKRVTPVSSLKRVATPVGRSGSTPNTVAFGYVPPLSDADDDATERGY